MRWADAATQATNRSDVWVVEIDGVTFESATAAAIAHGVSETTIALWCDGFTDTRRTDQSNGGYTAPRPNCARRRKYAV